MNLTDKELLSYSEQHLLYEVGMLANVRGLFLKGFDSTLIKNVAIESFVIHLRNLITFLYPTSFTKPTDIYAKDFFVDASEWEKICPKISTSLTNARNRAHKEIGHLTTERISDHNDPRKPWEILKLFNETLVILNLFCQYSDTKKLHEKVKMLVSQLNK